MTPLDRWFVHEVLPHEGALTRYIARFAPDEKEDVRQEVYARTYSSARGAIPTEARPFLFKIARNLLIDRARRASVISMDLLAGLENSLVVSDEPLVDRVVAGRQELELLMCALEDLPPRCREIVRLRKVEGLSQLEVAGRLGVTVSTVEKQTSKGVRRLADLLFGADELPYESDRRAEGHGCAMTSAKIVDEVAATWIAREDGQHWSDEDARVLNIWLDQDTRHRVAYLRLQAAWARADRLYEAQGGAPVRTESPARREPLWWRMPMAASAAFILALGGTSLAYWMTSVRGLHETAVGAVESLKLADGSRISLNTGTRIRERLNARERRIELQEGEAFFEVAKDRSRPFVVVAGDHQIVALGTAFSVRQDASKRLRVRVREGVIRVLGRGGKSVEQDLSAGMVLDATSNRAEVQSPGITAVEAALEWRHGYLVFESRPLGQVAQEFNRYTTTKITVTTAAASKPISGVFRTNNGVGFLRLVDGYPDLSATANGDNVLIDIEDHK